MKKSVFYCDSKNIWAGENGRLPSPNSPTPVVGKRHKRGEGLCMLHPLRPNLQDGVQIEYWRVENHGPWWILHGELLEGKPFGRSKIRFDYFGEERVRWVSNRNICKDEGRLDENDYPF